MEEPDHGRGEIQQSRSFGQIVGLPSSRKFIPLEIDDEETEDIDGLPSRRARNGKWWYSTYHNVTAMVGAGVLGLPSAMAYLGWGIGITVMMASWAITLFTLWQMIQMHEGADGKRIDTYHELGQKAFGRKLGLWIVVPQQLIVEVGLDIAYIVTGGLSLWHFYQLVLCDDLSPKQIGTKGKCCGRLGPTTFMIFFTLPQFFLAQMGNLDSIAGVSFFASLMSIGYCIVAWSLSIGEGKDNHKAGNSVSYDFPDKDGVFGAFSALGMVAFAYSGHNVVLEIQATLPSNKKKLSKVLMWRGVVVAYFVVAFCYFTVAFTAYWAYGENLAVSQEDRRNNPSSTNILLRFRQPRGLLAITHLMVSIHMVGSYQLYAMPVFQMMESVLEKFGYNPVPVGSSSTLRIVTRSTYIFLTAFVACTFPFFDSLLGLVGGFALAPTTYFLPCIIWLRVKRNDTKVFGVSWFINWALIIIGILLMVIGTTGGVWSFIEQAKHFEFYQFVASKTCLARMAPSPSPTS